ncbi:IclR family transcriptional regulator (plasmid) [Haloarcula marismortui]|uniref:IclR family transcriptional regulator n=1 Tax=Haloarcula marismortui TaxID=2238 RepID=UPI003C713CF0
MGSSHTLTTTENTIRIVDELREMDGAGVTEVANRVGISKSTAHDHLNTLRQHDLVVKDDGQYHVGLGFFGLGEHARRRHEIYEVARPEIDDLARETGELANLMVEEHGKGVYLYRSRGENAVTLDTDTGMRRYLHRTALGKAILSQLPETKVDEIIDRHGIPESTQNTITDRNELFDELRKIESEGIARCNQERVEGLQCVAAPVTSDGGRVLGAISVAVPTTRMHDGAFRETIPELVLQAANVIEINVTYS